MRRLLIVGVSLAMAAAVFADGDDSKKLTVEVGPVKATKRVSKKAPTPTAYLPVSAEYSHAMLCSLKRSENLTKWLDEVVNNALASQRVINKEDVFVTLIDLCPQQANLFGDSPGPVLAQVHGDEMQFASGFARLVYAVSVYNHYVKSCTPMDGAMQDKITLMLREGDDDATNEIVDFLSGTTSGPELAPAELCDFSLRRDYANWYLTNLGFMDFNVNQKMIASQPSGRDLQLLGEKLPLNYEHSNRLTTNQVAGMMYLLEQEALISGGASHAMKAYMHRPVEQQKLRPLSGIAAGLPVGSKLVSLNGYSVRNFHDAGIITLPSGQKYILAVMTKYNDYPTAFVPILSRYIAFRMQTSTGDEDTAQYLYIPPLASN